MEGRRGSDGCVCVGPEQRGLGQQKPSVSVLLERSHDPVDLLAHSTAASAHRGDVGRGQGKDVPIAGSLVEEALNATSLEIAGLGWRCIFMSVAGADQQCSRRQKSLIKGKGL